MDELQHFFFTPLPPRAESSLLACPPLFEARPLAVGLPWEVGLPSRIPTGVETQMKGKIWNLSGLWANPHSADQWPNGNMILQEDRASLAQVSMAAGTNR